MTSLNLISHVCEARKFVMAILHCCYKGCYLIKRILYPILIKPNKPWRGSMLRLSTSFMFSMDHSSTRSGLLDRLDVNPYPAQCKLLTINTTDFNWLTHYYNMLHFVQIYIAVENIVRKGEITCHKQFLPFLSLFSPLHGTFC